VIEPLGYDWKIGIALITSFAAREVFVGTMATLYSVEETDNTSLRQKMDAATHADGRKVYTLPAALSLDGILCIGHAMYEHARCC
jgi:ferrous iron transport protein B